MVGPVAQVDRSRAEGTRTIRFSGFDGLRALAALSVLCFHFYASSYRESGTDLPGGLHFFIGGLGSFGVAVFFVISGFLLGRPFLARQLEGRPPPELGSFWLRRFVRIFPAYWVALIGLALLGVQHTTEPERVAFHALLLQGYRGRWIGGGLDIAWTLVAEIGFYLLLPAIALGLRVIVAPRSSARRIVVVQVGGLLALVVVGLGLRAGWAWGWRGSVTAFGGWFPLSQLNLWVVGYLDWFALGMLLAVASSWVAAGGRLPWPLEALGRRPWLAWLAAFGLLWVVGQARLPLAWVGVQTDAQLYLRTTLDGIAAALLVLPAVIGNQARGVIRRGLRFRPVVWLGTISYGIYLWHIIYISVINRWVREGSVGSSRLLRFGLLVALTLVTAAASYIVVERPLVRLAHRRGRAAGDPATVRSSEPPRDRDPAPVPRSVAEIPRTGVIGVALAVAIAALGSVVGASVGADAPPIRRTTAAFGGQRRAVVDAFDRVVDATLGRAPTGQRWRSAVGDWRSEGGTATPVSSTESPFALALVAAPSDGDVEAVVMRVSNGSGLAFRCQDSANCWFLAADRPNRRWELSVVDAGRRRVVGEIRRSPRDGARILVRLDGDRIRVSVDGRSLITRNATNLEVEATGLVGTVGARFAKFSTAPLKPEFPKIYDTLAADDFFADGPLSSSGVPHWWQVRGSWTVTASMAHTSQPESAGPAIALIGTPASADVIRGTVGTSSVGYGLAFRCRDANNCWWVEAAPGYATWIVSRILDGRVERVGPIGLSTSAPGTVLTVVLSANDVEFWVDGRFRHRLSDPALADASGFGIASGVGASGPLARFWSVEVGATRSATEGGRR